MGLLLVFLAHYLTVSFQSLIRIVKYYSHWVFNFWGRNDYFELIAPFGSNTNGDGHCHWMEIWYFFLSYTSNNSHDKSGLFTNHFQFRNNSLVSKREVCRKVKVKHRN